MNIELRDLKEVDKKYFYLWVRDKEVTKYSLSIFQKMVTDNEISNWFDGMLSNKSSYKKAIIYCKKIIGYAGIAKISETNKSGEYFIFIGNKSYHNKKIGTFVTKEIVKHGFQQLGLNRIMLTVSEKNIGAIKVYNNADFKTEGIMKQAFYRDGKFHDKIIMAILKKEWIK